MPTPIRVSTISPCWLSISAFRRMKPSGLVREGQVSVISVRTVTVSPARTGFCQRQESMPGEPTPAISSRRMASTDSRIMIAHECQPLAMRPPKMLRRAASSSRWKGCGSYFVAKAMISSALTVCEPSVLVSPGWMSSQYFIRFLSPFGGPGRLAASRRRG